jgi:hypothetical protein
MRSRTIAMALAALVAASAAQGASPPRRAHHALVYDEARRLVLLTAGSTPLDQGQRFQFFNDLWAWDGSTWRSIGASGDEMSGIGLAYDPDRKRVFSFGGYSGRSLEVLRALENDRWKELTPLHEMPVAEPGFVYDRARRRFVAFGGSQGPGRAAGDTWEFDGMSWTRVGVPGPPARQAHAMAFDARRGRTVVFGGMGEAPQGQRPPAFGDTWEYDGRAWTKVDSTGPVARNGAGVAYDSKRGLVILFGGAGEAGFLGDTWAWNGKSWRKLADQGPEPRVMGYLAYDAKRDRVVMFGGRKGWPDGDLNDTWEWDGKVWRRVAGDAPAK